MTVPAPPVTQIAQDAYDWLGPVQADDPARGWPLLAFMGGIGEMFREVEQLVRARPGREPWQQAFDINQCPDFQVPWLGQMVGQRVTVSAPATVQRQQVSAEGGFKRGRPATLVAVVQSTLTGTRGVSLTERVSDAWTMTVVTDPAETPNVTVTAAAAQRAKVAGLVLTVLQSSVPIVDQGTRSIDASTGTIETAVLLDIT